MVHFHCCCFISKSASKGMLKNERQVHSFASSMALGYWTREHMFTKVLPKVGMMIAGHCEKNVEQFTSSTHLNMILCTLVTFFQRAMDDYMGLHIVRILLALFGTVQVFMAIEGSRYGYSWYNVVAWAAFWGALCNVLTVAIVSSLLWLPLFVLTSYRFATRSKNALSSQESDRPFDDSTVPVMVNPARVYAIFVTYLAVYGVPTVLMTTSWVFSFDTKASMAINAFWQLCPLLIQPMYVVLTWLFDRFLYDQRVVGRSGLPVEENRTRQRVRMVKSKSAVERVYLLLGVINLVVYYSAYLQINWDGVHLKDALLMLVTAQPPSSGMRPPHKLQFFCAHFMLVDLLVTSVSFTLWAAYQQGLWIGLLVLAGTIVLGPGTSFAIYACYREYNLQDTQLLVDRAKSDKKAL
ncbi:hypothetical protein DM01DRAFT_1383901 [Hesseltinella vesiculosa]|uniref:Uncharacterized protein n=1 Tax=Hesseltinella vesiculosa TaxID=101127 RepID=A0A1X2GFM0_9FUNG|nr:hypothetical protein DM01DRAFT_1383901 [Hesseltinella vesiculosa]